MIKFALKNLATKKIQALLIMLSVWCVLRIIYITVAMQISHEIVLLFAAYPLTWFISSVIYMIYYKKSNWVHGFETDERKKRRNA